MSAWIIKIYEQFVFSLNDKCDIIDLRKMMDTITTFEQASLTKEQLLNSRILEQIQSVYHRTQDQFLKYRLEILLQKWNNLVMGKSKNSHSVFEAILKGDEDFFETTSVSDLFHRLSKSVDTNFKVIDMATVLNTISILERLDISPAQMTQYNLMNYVRKLHDNTTNIYLAQQSGKLLMKWNCVNVICKKEPEVPDKSENSSLVVKLKLSKEIVKIVHIARLKSKQ